MCMLWGSELIKISVQRGGSRGVEYLMQLKVCSGFRAAVSRGGSVGRWFPGHFLPLEKLSELREMPLLMMRIGSLRELK